MTTTFRFKFSNEFIDTLQSFSKLHQYDDRVTYKESWDKWVLINEDLISQESRRLVENGYTGNTTDKMYKSGRYYFRTKTTNNNEPKKRRKYISIEKDMIEAMDNHILKHVHEETFKPSVAYDSFCQEYSTIITEETTRLKEQDLNDENILLKLKKTFKNRYFLYSTQNEKLKNID